MFIHTLYGSYICVFIREKIIMCTSDSARSVSPLFREKKKIAHTAAASIPFGTVTYPLGAFIVKTSQLPKFHFRMAHLARRGYLVYTQSGRDYIDTFLISVRAEYCQIWSRSISGGRRRIITIIQTRNCGQPVKCSRVRLLPGQRSEECIRRM